MKNIELKIIDYLLDNDWTIEILSALLTFIFFILPLTFIIWQYNKV